MFDRHDDLNELLYNKMQSELDKLVADLRNALTPEDVISASFELTHKTNILYCFDVEWDGYMPLPKEKALMLYSMEKPLDFLYREWMKYDDYLLGLMRDCCNGAIEREYAASKGETVRLYETIRNM